MFSGLWTNVKKKLEWVRSQLRDLKPNQTELYHAKNTRVILLFVRRVIFGHFNNYTLSDSAYLRNTPSQIRHKNSWHWIDPNNSKSYRSVVVMLYVWFSLCVIQILKSNWKKKQQSHVTVPVIRFFIYFHFLLLKVSLTILIIVTYFTFTGFSSKPIIGKGRF